MNIARRNAPAPATAPATAPAIAHATARALARATALTALALLGPAAALAQAGADDIERGRALFMKNGCYSCHGTVGQGGGDRSGAPKLAPGTYPFEAFRVLVRTPREAMPRFDEQYVSDAQLQLIHGYLASLPQGRRAADIPELR